MKTKEHNMIWYHGINMTTRLLIPDGLRVKEVKDKKGKRFILDEFPPEVLAYDLRVERMDAIKHGIPIDSQYVNIYA